MRRRKFIQARLADLRFGRPRLFPAPKSTLLQRPDGQIHEIDPAAVSEIGVRLEARYVLARGTDGEPHLWLRKRQCPRPPINGPELAFDVLAGDFAQGEAQKPPEVDLSITVGTVSPVATGVLRCAPEVTVTNRSARSLDTLVVYLVGDRRGFLDPPSHEPVAVELLGPGATTTLTIPATFRHAREQDATLKLRAAAVLRSQLRAIPVVASGNVDVEAIGPSPDLALAVSGPARVDGAVVEVPFTVSAAALPLEEVAMQVRGIGGTRWQTAVVLPGGASADAGVRNIVVRFNAALAPVPTSLRAMVTPPASESVRFTSPTLLEDDTLLRASPASAELTLRAEVRDAQSRDGAVELLLAVFAENTGDDGIADLELVVERFVQLGEDSGWRTLTSTHRSFDPALPVAGKLALPVVVRLEEPAGLVAWLRVSVTSARMAAGTSVTLTQALPAR